MALAAVAALVPQPVLTIDPRHRLVEGIATDGSTIWVSSVIDRQILACTTRCRTIAILPRPLHPLGLAWDRGRKLLWVAADCLDPEHLDAKCDGGALVAVSRSGKMRARLAPPGIAFRPGDVSASRSGIFVSDSQSGLVWALMPGRRELRAVNRPGDGKSAQGTALAPSGTALIVADYSRGIGSIDLKTTATTWLPRQDGKPLRGIDGLVRCGDMYLGVYNGQAPGAVVTIRMRRGGIEYGELVEDLSLPDPTQVAFDGKRLLVVGDSGWAMLERPGFVRTRGAPILAIPLSPGCQPR